MSENALAGDPHWDITHLGPPGAMLGYAGQVSVLPGEPVTIYASTTARSFTVSAFRMGWYRGDLARLVWRSAAVPGHRQRKPDLIRPANTVEAHWEPSLTVPTHGWPEGSYLLRLDAESGAQRFVPVTVRSAATAGKIVIKNGVETWQAYNTWGGYDLYHGPGGIADYSNRSLAVSLDRPYDLSGADMFLTYERNVVKLAESLGLPLAYALERASPNRGQLLGVIVLSDGQHNLGDSPAALARELGERSLPIYPIALGAEKPPSAVAVVAVKGPASVFKDIDATIDVRFGTRAPVPEAAAAATILSAPDLPESVSRFNRCRSARKSAAC